MKVRYDAWLLTSTRQRTLNTRKTSYAMSRFLSTKSVVPAAGRAAALHTNRTVYHEPGEAVDNKNSSLPNFHSFSTYRKLEINSHESIIWPNRHRYILTRGGKIRRCSLSSLTLLSASLRMPIIFFLLSIHLFFPCLLFLFYCSFLSLVYPLLPNMQHLTFSRSHVS